MISKPFDGCLHFLDFRECWKRVENKEVASNKSVLQEYKFTCGCSEVCFSFNNKKVGSSNRKFCNGAIMNRFYRKGVLNGISRTVDSSGKLSSFGRWTKGCKVGTWWERVEGDGWVI